MRLIRYLPVAGLVIASAVAAQAAGNPDDIDPVTLYNQYCSVCHGDRGDGQSHARQGLMPPPRDFTNPEVAAHLDREHMLDAVRNGRPNTAMVAWDSRLSEQQIEAVVDYIREQFMPAVQSAAWRRGETVYRRNCSVCHGDQGSGANWGRHSLNPPPRDFTSEPARRELSRERMLIAVTHGRPGTAMAAFGSQLDTTDIEAVVDYIRAAFIKAPPQSAAHHAGDDAHGHGAHDHENRIADMSEPYPDALQGERRTGEAFYRQNCEVCHGVEGDGEGPRAYFIRPRPRNFLHPAVRLTFNRPALFHAIKEGVRGREMPAWGKVLSDQQIADVSEYVFQQFIRGPEQP